MYLEQSRERCHLQAVTRALACQCCVGVRWVADAADQASSTASIASMAMHAALTRLRDWAPALAQRQRHGTFHGKRTDERSCWCVFGNAVNEIILLV